MTGKGSVEILAIRAPESEQIPHPAKTAGIRDDIYEERWAKRDVNRARESGRDAGRQGGTSGMAANYQRGC
jgi:hypothetical protein